MARALHLVLTVVVTALCGVAAAEPSVVLLYGDGLASVTTAAPAPRRVRGRNRRRVQPGRASATPVVVKTAPIVVEAAALAPKQEPEWTPVISTKEGRAYAFRVVR